MKKVIEKWNQISLIKRIICGLILGLILGLTIPQVTVISMLGDIFVGALKAIAPVLVFFLVMSALSGQHIGQRTNMSTIIILYLLGTFLAGAVAVIASFLFPVSLTLTENTQDLTAPGGVGEVLTNLLMNIVSNPINALAEANYVGVLTWAVIFGIALKRASDSTKQMLSDIADAISTAVRWIISCAPFGIMGLMFTTVSQQGLNVLASYGRLLIILLGTMFFVALIVNPLIAYICMRRNPYPLVFRCLRDSGLTAFFTRSSAANIPVNMELCESLGLDEDTYSISIPLAATHTLNIHVDLPTAIILCVLSAASACGASGVAGGSLLLIPLACSLFGIPNDLSMQVVGVGFIIGVLQDSCETALNSSTDALFTAIAEFRDRRLHPERYTSKS